MCPLAEITVEATAILIREVGVLDAFRFLSQIRAGSGDYTKERGRWLDDLSLDQNQPLRGLEVMFLSVRRSGQKNRKRFENFALIWAGCRIYHNPSAIRIVRPRGTGIATMKTDPLFYRLFETSPETFFLLLGMSANQASDTAARYEYTAPEFKETSHRVDGVFMPKEAGLPVYFLEVQFYPLPNVYAGLLAKVYTYLKRHDPAQSFRGVVLFADRSLEPKELTPYQPLLDAG